jgi:hypothetical protein
VSGKPRVKRGLQACMGLCAALRCARPTSSPNPRPRPLKAPSSQPPPPPFPGPTPHHEGADLGAHRALVGGEQAVQRERIVRARGKLCHRSGLGRGLRKRAASRRGGQGRGSARPRGLSRAAAAGHAGPRLGLVEGGGQLVARSGCSGRPHLGERAHEAAGVRHDRRSGRATREQLVYRHRLAILACGGGHGMLVW